MNLDKIENMKNNKNKKSGMVAKLWLCAMLLLTAIPVASADLTCEGLNDPQATKSLVISIIEEQFGEPGSTGDSITSLKCLRETICKEEKVEDKTEKKCKSEYKPSCSPSGADPKNVTICQQVQVFYSQSGIDLLFSYIGLIYRWSAGVIGIVSVFYLIYGGIKITTAGDNTAALDEAKTKIGQSLAGLVLLFVSAIILYTINPNFFVL